MAGLQYASISSNRASATITSVHFLIERQEKFPARVPWAILCLLLVAGGFGRWEEEVGCLLGGLVRFLSESERLVGWFSAGNRLKQRIVYFC